MSDSFGYSTSKSLDYVLEMADVDTSSASSTSGSSSEDETEMGANGSSMAERKCEVCKEMPVYNDMTRREKQKTMYMLLWMNMDKSKNANLKICYRCWHFIRDTWDHYELFLSRIAVNTTRFADIACFLCNSTMLLTNFLANKTCLEVLTNMELSLPQVPVDTVITVCNACELMMILLQRLYCLTIYKRLVNTAATNAEGQQ